MTSVLRALAISLCAIWLCFGGAGCSNRGKAPQPRLVDIRVVLPDGEADRAGGADAGALADRVEARFKADPVIAVARGGELRPSVDYRLKMEAFLQREEAGEQATLRAFVTARMSRDSAEPPIVSRVIAERAFKKSEAADAAVARAHLERAVDDAVRGLLPSLRLRMGGAPEVLEALDGKEPELRGEAIRLAGERRLAAGVPKLIQLLKDEDTKTRDQALGALVEIGDRRAVKPVTQMARFRETDELPKVIDAMGSLGGDEARAYLEFVISAHDDAAMRTLAKEALVRLDRSATAPEGGAPRE